MTVAPILRPLRRGDAEAAAALVRAAFAAQDATTDPPSSALRETADSLRGWIAAGGGICVEDAGAPPPGLTGLTRPAALAALLLWAERDGGLYCGRLAVAPAARGRGFARLLMADAEREARRRGLPRLHLRARLALPGNIAFFAALGFCEVAREAHAGYAEATTSVMTKLLDRGPETRGGARGGV